MEDLSEYELKRLRNIERNNAMMASLGLENKQDQARRARKAQSDEAKAATNRRKLAAVSRVPAKPSRSSRRLQKRPRVDYREEKLFAVSSSPNMTISEKRKEHTEEESESESESEEEEGLSPIDYERLPLEPNDLDDMEFQAYILLKGWRLERHRELEIEPYKVAQNRTLVELVRRRRNDAAFSALIEVWGIGPSKVLTFGPEMLQVLDSAKARELLELSRTSATEKEDDGSFV